MDIKNAFFLFLMIITLSLPAQKESVISDAIYSAITIDGLPNEWDETLRYYDGSSKLQFGFKNDSSNLYVCIKTSDEMAQLKIMTAGMELSIQTTKRALATIAFPMEKQPDRPSQIPPGVDPNQRPDIKFMKRRMVAELVHMKLTGFADLPNGIYNTETKSGIKVAINFDSLDVLTVEYKIPLASLTSKIDPVKPISAEIHLYGLQMPGGNGMEPPPGNTQSGVGMPGGSMGRGSGGMGGGMPSGGMGGGMPTGGMGGDMPPEGMPPPPGMDGNNTVSQEIFIRLKLKLARW